jgi:hypothetical protein
MYVRLPDRSFLFTLLLGTVTRFLLGLLTDRQQEIDWKNICELEFYHTFMTGGDGSLWFQMLYLLIRYLTYLNPKGKGKDGKDSKQKKWTCKDCGATTAPYQSAMDQHKWSSERCLAWQRYNKLPQTEKDKEESWTECLEYAQRMRLSRRTDVDGTLADDREASPLGC